jgi:hypothetical protein
LSLGLGIVNPLEAFACTPEIQKARLEELDSQIALYKDLANSPSPKEQEEKRKTGIKTRKLLKITNSNPVIKTALENVKSQIEAKLEQEIENIHTFAIDFGQFSLKNKQLTGTISVDIQYNYGKDIDGDEQYGFETKSYNVSLDIAKKDLKIELPTLDNTAIPDSKIDNSGKIFTNKEQEAQCRNSKKDKKQKYMPLLSGHTDAVLNRKLIDTGYWKYYPNAKIYFNRPSNDYFFYDQDSLRYIIIS